jgi:hypothetical protein
MMRFVKVAVVAGICLLALPSICQQGTAACGNPAIKFDVKTADSISTVPQPAAGIALVVFVGKDAGTAMASTTRVAIDGNWVGAAHGSSYFYFSVEPGVHHVCTLTKFNQVWAHPVTTAAAHFTAVAGETYFFEAKNYAFADAQQFDVTLTPLDSDEGPIAISNLPASEYREKK